MSESEEPVCDFCGQPSLDPLCDYCYEEFLYYDDDDYDDYVDPIDEP